MLSITNHVVAMLLACTVLVSCMSLHAIADGVCSTSMAPLQVNKIQIYNGVRGDTFTWIFSPGKLTSTLPTNKLACNPPEIYGGQWRAIQWPYECILGPYRPIWRSPVVYIRPLQTY
eukprot:Tbor_TRINITY_DN5955_c1_g3::TRINITY_DN5955_c1_g3_i5::g.18306::m.18306